MRRFHMAHVVFGRPQRCTMCWRAPCCFIGIAVAVLVNFLFARTFGFVKLPVALSAAVWDGAFGNILCRKGAAQTVRWRHLCGRGSGLSKEVFVDDDYEIVIDRTNGSKLGMRLAHEKGGTELVVIGIEPGLLCDEWNAANPSKAVALGDRIIEADTVRGDPKLMCEHAREV